MSLLAALGRVEGYACLDQLNIVLLLEDEVEEKEDVWMLKMVNVVILMRCVGEVGRDGVEGMVG